MSDQSPNRKHEHDPEELARVVAHALGHVIAHIVTETYFDYVWVRGVNKMYDGWIDSRPDGKNMAGCVHSYRYFLQSTAAIVDSPGANLQKILQAMKDGKDIVDAVMAYDKYPAVTSDLVTDEPEHFVHTSGPNYCTPEEVVAFLNEPLEDSDEAA